MTTFNINSHWLPELKKWELSGTMINGLKAQEIFFEENFDTEEEAKKFLDNRLKNGENSSK